MILVEWKKENNFFADFAYLLEFNNNHKVSFGVKDLQICKLILMVLFLKVVI
jgi:hypothetical protein